MKFFWYWFHKHFGNPDIYRLSIPMTILSNFDAHYFLFDNKGDVVDCACNMIEAIKKHKASGLYVTHVID